MKTTRTHNQGPNRSVFSLFRCFLLTAIALAAHNTGQAQTISHQVTLPPTMYWCDDSMINTLFSEINSLRAKNGLPALRSDRLGDKVAELRAVQFANYMATHSLSTPGFNPHEGYDTTAASAGYNLVSENLAYLSMYPGWIVWSIWQDRLHMAAMLNSQANVAGVSCLMFDGGPFWTYEPGISSGAPSPAPAPAPAPSPAPTPVPIPIPAPAPTPPPSAGTATLDVEQARFLTLINAYRTQNGAPALQVSLALQNASQWMSADMAKRGFGNHIDSLGRSPSSRMADFGYPYSPNGENIAGGLDDAQGTFDQWQNACDADAAGRCTYAHRVNMLNPGYVVLGIGRAYGPGTVYGWYWTTDFGGYLDRTITPGGGPGPASPPPPAAPVLSSFSANPTNIVAGQSSTISWNISGATALSIDVLGNVTGLTSKLVSPTQTTSYWITATNANGTTAGRLTIYVTGTPAPPNPAPPVTDTQPPTVPVITSAAASAPNQVTLAWTMSTDNIGVAGYQVIRTGSLIANTSSATRSFTDLTASSGATYTYTVRAFDAASNFSNLSNTVQVTTPTAPVSPPPAPVPSPGPVPGPAPSPVNPGPASCATPAINAFTGCYYNNITLSGTPSLVRTDNQVNFNWGTDSPSPAVTPLNFSTRWQGYFTFQQGEYLFSTMASDGLRLYIDGELILDRWRDQPGYMYNLRRTLAQGQHLVTVEYYERTGLPLISIAWQKN